MIWRKSCWFFLPVLLVFGAEGCGTFMANRMVQSPNTYPDWFAPRWLPKTLVKAGLKKLPFVLGTTAGELDTTTVMARSPVAALFVAGAEDKIAPVADVKQLRALAAPGSELIVVPDATHESVTYFFPPWFRQS